MSYVDYKIHGDDVQFLQIILDPGESILAEVGTLFFKDTDIEMHTGVEWGMLKWLGRMFIWESFFITSFTNNGASRKQVAFSAPYMWKVVMIDLDQFQWKFICQKDSFLCSENTVEISVEFNKKIWAGFFGWEWFLLQKLEWTGTAFVHAGWSIVKLELQPGKKLHIDTGCIVGFSKDVQYNIEKVKGVKNMLFGSEWFFFATLEWPWTVYLQSLPFSTLADKIISASWFMGRQGSSTLGSAESLLWIAGRIIK